MRAEYGREGNIHLTLTPEEVKLLKREPAYMPMLSAISDGRYFTVSNPRECSGISVREPSGPGIPYFIEIGDRLYERLLSERELTAQYKNRTERTHFITISVENP